MDTESLLAAPPFRSLSEGDIAPLTAAAGFCATSYAAGDIIARQGDMYRKPLVLLRGAARTQMVSPDGKQLTVENLSAPRLMAPAFLFATENRFPVNIEATADCRAATFPRHELLELLHRHPAAMADFLRLVSDRALFLSEKVAAFALQSLKSRLLNYLRIHGTLESQAEAAQILGVARPSLARALAELTAEGCIAAEGKRVRVDEEASRRYLSN